MTPKVIKIILDGREILLDKRDLKGVDLSNLRISVNGYAVVGRELLHRLIMKPSEDMEIDHKNLNKLDNRRCNLRICTHSGNMMNRGKQKNSSVVYKGVTLNKGCKRKKYQARITVNGKTYFLGNFKRSEVAGVAYKEASKKYHGKFARTSD